MRYLIWAAACLVACSAASGETLDVGPGKRFARPSQAVQAAKPGDVIEIASAGNYDGDCFIVRQNNITLRGVGEGRAKIAAKGKNAGGKGILVTAGDDITVENIEFSGARVPDENGAGIRIEGKNLTVRHCKFDDCENGLLGGKGVVTIEYCEFTRCGLRSNPAAHNAYIGAADKLVYRFNYSHHALVGHLLKSRAAENQILYNLIADEETGSSSYVLDLPNGGKSFIIGNILQHGPRAQNRVIVAYGEEGIKHPDSALYVVNNDFINDCAAGNPVFIRVRKTPENFACVVKNNIFLGKGQVVDGCRSEVAANLVGGDPGVVDRAKWDLHLAKDSLCIDKGVDPGKAGDMPLKPAAEYLHPLGKGDRPGDGRLDIGAYEFKQE